MNFAELASREGDLSPLMRSLLLANHIFHFQAEWILPRIQTAFFWVDSMGKAGPFNRDNLCKCIDEVKRNLEVAETQLRYPLFLNLTEGGPFGSPDLLPWRKLEENFHLGVKGALSYWALAAGENNFPRPAISIAKVEDRMPHAFLVKVNPFAFQWLVGFLTELAIGSARQVGEFGSGDPTVSLDLSVKEKKVVFSVEYNGSPLPEEVVEGLRKGEPIFPTFMEELSINLLLVQLAVGAENLLIFPLSGGNGGNVIRVSFDKFDPSSV